MYKMNARVKEVQLGGVAGHPSKARLSMSKALTPPNSDAAYNLLFKIGSVGGLTDQDQPESIARKEELTFKFSERFEPIMLDLYKTGRAATFIVKMKTKKQKNVCMIRKIILTGEQ